VGIPGNPSLAATPLLASWLDFSMPGMVHARTGKSELGQGIDTALVQIVADALGVDQDQVVLVKPDTRGPDETFTAGSLSVQHSGGALVAAATHARVLFTRAAREQLGDDAVLANGRFTDGANAISYWDLAAEVDLETPVDMSLEHPAPTGVIGFSAPRSDLADKVLGRPRYVQDMRLDGMVFARIVRPPSRGSRLLDADVDIVRERHDIVDVVIDGDFVAIVAETEISAVQGATATAGLLSWSHSDETLIDGEVTAFLTSVSTDDTELSAGSVPDAPVLSARYTRPFIAHASIGPSCAIAIDRAGVLQVWSHTQGVYPLRRDIARALGRDESSVHVSHVEGAGCYGHNPADDVAYDAALLATRIPNRPVQVTWSREDELSWSPFGPAMVVDIAAATDDTGIITSWSWDGYGNGHSSRPSTLPSPSLLTFAQQQDGTPIPPSGDPPLASGAGTGRNALPGYRVGEVRAIAHRAKEMPIRASALRSLGAHLNVFAIESHMDALARLHDIDPREYRMRHLDDERGRAVIEAAAEASGWGRQMAEDHGIGMGYARYKGSGAWCAVVAEVEAVSEIRVAGLWIAVDCGRVINPNGVANQIEGGALQSLSWTLKERVRFSAGRVESRTWEEYPILTFGEVPPVEVTLLDRPEEPWLGAGEASMGPTAAALGNAVADALGVRVRDLPLTSDAIVAAMSS